MTEDFRQILLIQYRSNPIVHKVINSMSKLLLDNPDDHEKMEMAAKIFEPFFIAGMIHGGKIKEITDEHKKMITLMKSRQTGFTNLFSDANEHKYHDRCYMGVNHANVGEDQTILHIGGSEYVPSPVVAMLRDIYQHDKISIYQKLKFVDREPEDES
jgi:hypothetical protein